MTSRYKGHTEKKSKASKMAKVIKRYGNRKLYDTEKSAYVVLNDIAKMIRNEEEVRIIDNDTKHDITSTTLTQIIFGAEKKSSYSAPLNLLKSIIKKGDGSFSNFLSEMGLFQASKEWAASAAAAADKSNPLSSGSAADMKRGKKEMYHKTIQDRVVNAVLSQNEMDQGEKTILPTSKNPNVNSDF